jgi:hypothetical protein
MKSLSALEYLKTRLLKNFERSFLIMLVLGYVLLYHNHLKDATGSINS